jgi:hypothetical protein
VAAPELHPAIAGAVAAEKKEPSAPVPEATGVRAPRSASVATLVAALVLAVIAAVTVALIFG